MTYNVKRNLAIIGAGLVAQIALLLAGCYWFAFRHHYQGYFLFVIGVLLLSLVFNFSVMLRSRAQNA